MKTKSHLHLALAALVLATAAGTSQAVYIVPTSGLIGYWSGNGVATDASPTANNGSFGGSYVPGPTGGMAFNLGSAKVTIPNNAAYNFRSYAGWSVGFWFSDNGSPINAGNGLFLGQDNGSGYQPKWFIDYSYSVYGNNSSYNFHVNDYNRQRIFVGSQPKPAPTGWNQLTVTIDNTNASNCLASFYLNGVPSGTASMGPYVLQTNAPLIFGQAEALSFNGLMSNVAIYNRVISPAEALQLATVPEPASTTLLLGGSLLLALGRRRRKAVV